MPEFLIFSRVSFPFDWKTPFGYVSCVLIELFVVFAACELYVSVVGLTVGVCMVIADFASDNKEKLHQFNRILTGLEDLEISAKDRVMLKKKLTEIIEFNVEARELSYCTIKFFEKNIPI